LAQWILGAVAPALASVALLLPAASFAENELAALGAKGFDSSLIDTECFTTRCALPAKSCLESNDCRKGMMCTAKCLGDNACITGCFAKYGNAEMSDLLECSVEREGCIKIAILEGGADTLEAAPPPPAPLVATASATRSPPSAPTRAGGRAATSTSMSSSPCRGRRAASSRRRRRRTRCASSSASSSTTPASGRATNRSS
jgi:hypothetical protein